MGFATTLRLRATGRLSIRGERRVWRSSGWGFVTPYLVILVAFGVAPAVYGLYQAFIVTSVVGPSYFSPTTNFIDVLTDYRLPGAVANVAEYLLIWLPLLFVVVFLPA